MQTPETGAALAEARGWLAANDGGSAAELLRAAAAGWASIGRPLDQARALSRLGRAQAGAEPWQQAMRLIQSLAEQIDDPELRASFLNSQLAQEIEQGNQGKQ